MKFRYSGATAAGFALILSFFLFSESIFAQSDNDEENVVVLELGGVPSWSITEPGSSFGPTFAFEVEPVKNWLELEIGVTSAFGRHSTEWSTDLLFKKPWTLNRKIEFMVGIGPEWIRTKGSGITTNALAGEAVLDFMFWTSPKHRIGWYLEPGYDYSFRAGHERSAGIAIGLLIGIR